MSIIEDVDVVVQEQADVALPGYTQEQVEAWKAQYGQVYVSEFGEGEVFVWRCITRAEYRKIMSMQRLDMWQREEEICKICVLDPEGYNYATAKAGIATILAEQILNKSGFIVDSLPQEL
ncbi:MAG: tail chaperonin [Bacillota bacterium]